jgi:uncharacterized membrane protein YiaA
MDSIDHEPWQLRAAILGGLGALFGLLVWKLTRGLDTWMWTDSPFRMAVSTFLAVGGVVFAFSLERVRWHWAAAFAALAGAVVALVAWWNGAPQDWGQGEGWQFFSSIIAVAVAVPLFQSARDRGERRVSVRAVHHHVWTNLILGAAAGAFVIASFLVLLLLSELFRLIGIDLLRDLFQEGWFPPMVAGGALGAAVGLLRDRDKVLGLLQRVATSVLSVLAPVLAAGLLIFVLALPFTGLEPLWSQTKSTTPILLICILGAVVLTNAVIGNAADEEARSRVLRYAATALIAVMLPLAIVAAVSTGKRIGQYGYTPDRLWAAVFVAVAIGFAGFYLYALVRGRAAWPERLRSANIRLALGLCGLALFLALPIVNFGAISTRDQLARLESGRVAPDKFDWAALRFDFGPSGRQALERVARTGPARLQQLARQTLKAENRWSVPGFGTGVQSTRIAPAEPPKLRPIPENTPIPPALHQRISDTALCRQIECRLIFDSPDRVLLVSIGCPDCGADALLYRLTPTQGWVLEQLRPGVVDSGHGRGGQPARHRRALAEGRLEIRPVEKRQLFLDGEPLGLPFDP